MNLKTKNTIQTHFSMASMTDVIFLLLIFLMLTASHHIPSSLPINLPKSEVSNTTLHKIKVSITADIQYYVDDEKTNIQHLFNILKQKIHSKNTIIALYVDESVAIVHMVKVASMASKLKTKVAIVTQQKI